MSVTQQKPDKPSETLHADTPPQGRPVRWAVVIGLGVVLTALNASWMSYMEMAWNQGYAVMLSLYYNVVFTIVVVLAVNAVVRLFRPLFALHSREILILFIMATMGTSVAMMTEYLTSFLAFPYQYHTMNERWATDLIPHLPRSLTVSDPRAIEAYYLGARDGWGWSLLKPWLLPFIGWGLLMAATVWTGICLSALVYNRWRHQERLAFPIVQIPLMIAEQGHSFWRSRLFWVAFCLAAGLDIVNALHVFFPSVPALAVKRQGFAFPGLPAPWSAISPVFYSWNPLLIGLEFFLPLDLLFSVWFFYWAGKLQGVLLSYLGVIPSGPGEVVSASVREQAFGALIALLLFSLWTARGHWRESWRKYPMPMPEKKAMTGAALGAAVMVGVLVIAGMRPDIAILFVVIYLAAMLSLARVRAQYGPPSAGLLLGAPGPVIYGMLGKDGLGTGGLSSLAVTHWMGREFAGHPMPSTIESFAIAERRTSRRGVVIAIMVGAMVGYAATFYTAIATGYDMGHATAKMGGTQFYFGNEACSQFSSRLADAQSGPHAESLIMIGIGMLVTFALQALRVQFVGFPLHPVGYAIGGTYISAYVWSTALITWLFKLTLLRYAGLKGYRKAMPFFLGLLLGEFMVGSALSLMGIFFKIPTYVIWPY